MNIKVSSFMNRKPLTLPKESTLNEVMKLMNHANISHVLITGDYGKFSGIISKEDILKTLKILIKGTGGQEYNQKILNNTYANEIMTKECITLKENDAVEYAVELLLQGKFHILPVVNNDKLTGVIGFSDLLKKYYQSFS